MKKLLSIFACGLASVAAFAEESGTTGSGGIIEVSDISEIFTNAQSSMTSLLEAALPVIIAFVGGGLIIWGALALISVIKRGLNAGKGR